MHAYLIHVFPLITKHITLSLASLSSTMEAGHDHYTRLFTTFKKIESALIRSIRPQFRIKFNFFIKFKTSFWIHNQQIHPTPYFIDEGPTSRRNTSTAAFTVRGSVSYDEIREAVGRAVGDILPAGDRRCLIELACEAVADNLGAKPDLPKHTILEVDFKIRVDVLRVVSAGGGDDHRMVPAADSALGMLEKHEVDDESSCCICLEEFGGGGGGGGALRMPCLHVFHGDCIEKWLRTSHYCPVCRYEMPTQ